MSLLVACCRYAFTLAELLILVAILGILAAVVVPEYRGHAQLAKESAAKENLQILRNVIDRYAIQHDGIAPGYPGDDPSLTPNNLAFYNQIIKYGKHLSGLPVNPFNEKDTIKVIIDADDFPTEPIMTDSYGWVYKPATKTVKLNWLGTDSAGTSFFDY